LSATGLAGPIPIVEIVVAGVVHKAVTEVLAIIEKPTDMFSKVLIEHNSKINIPIYISLLLIILKNLFYNFNLISKNNYKYIKKIIINYLVEGTDTEFVTTDIPKHKEDK
jgi:hypothetical protein